MRPMNSSIRASPPIAMRSTCDRRNAGHSQPARASVARSTTSAPVGIGCSNDEENLWIQRADTTYNGQPMGFHQKDDLEAWGIAQVKAGTLTPEEFDRWIWGDWVAYYLEVRPAHSNVSN